MSLSHHKQELHMKSKVNESLLRGEGGRSCYLLSLSKEHKAASEDVLTNEDETIFSLLDWPLTGEVGADANKRA